MRGVGRSIGETVAETVGRVMAKTQEKRPLPSDLLESDDAYLVIFDAPGAHSSDIRVRFEDKTVRVRLDRFREPSEGFDLAIPGRGLALSGEVTLPEDATVDAESATATLKENGTLHVLIPKADSAAETETVEVTAKDDEDDGEGGVETEDTDESETTDEAETRDEN